MLTLIMGGCRNQQLEKSYVMNGRLIIPFDLDIAVFHSLFIVSRVLPTARISFCFAIRRAAISDF
jgi:hypothetical protein